MKWGMRIGGRELSQDGQPLIVGVLNVSPESPNQDSVAAGPEQGAERARWLCEQGADIIDVGARSSNFAVPDAGWREELRRLVPVVETLVSRGFIVSVDTWEARVMRAATAAGAHMINDAEGLQSEAAISAVAEAGLPVVVPFVNGPDPRRLAPFDLSDPFAAMLPWFEAALERADRAGIADVILDPGTGFARRGLGHEAHDHLQRRVHAELHRLRVLGRPLFVAVPRRARPWDTLELARQLVSARAEFLRAHDPGLVASAILGQR